ncbi:MAG: SoxR reducing system RseC family protein [Candidatus Cloacimonetes bacterium]|nr:SoxR reducing system RseC family protein [Candidatus Cloacimonadota bacterium]
MSSEHVADSGVVCEVNGSTVKVEVQRGSGCKSCQMRGFCFSKNTPAVFTLSSALPLQVGDRVELDISAKDRILASLIIFVMPIAFLFGAFLVAQLFFGELISIALAFAAMALSFLIIRYFDRIFGDKFKVEIVRKIEDTTE